MSASGTIERREMMNPMLDASPSFRPIWDEFVAEWVPSLEEDGQNDLPEYLALSELANHLIKRLEAGETQEFPAVFAVVENWINNGDAYVSEAAVVGLLEDLSSEVRYKTAKPVAFVPWMGPQSRKWWAEVIDFWARLEAGRFRQLSID